MLRNSEDQHREVMANFDQPYQSLEDLDETTVRRDIIVRLIRQWEARNPRRGNQLMSLDLLLLDEKDNLIKASINHRLIGKFKHILHEGSIVQIKDFDIVKCSGRFKLTDHMYQIYFSNLTSVTAVLEDAPEISQTKFRIQDYDNLLRIANTNEELPDVIGRIVFVLGSNLRDIESTNKVTASLLLQNGHKVKLSVWDNIASDFRAFLNATDMKKRVVVITAVNPKMFLGELYLNSSSATRFYMNEEMDILKQYMSVHKLESSNSSPLGERELEPTNIGITTISQMFSFLDLEEPQDKSFYCKATIVGIETQNGWSYISCSRCFKKLIKENTNLMCPNCNDTNVIGIIRFRLEVIVEDETGRGTFIIFDKDGRNLTNTLAAEILSIEVGGTTEKEEPKEELLPACIQSLIGQTYVFEVTVKPFDFKSRYKTFTVSRIVNECSEPATKSLKRKEISPTKIKMDTHTKCYRRQIKKEDGSHVTHNIHEEKKTKNSRKKKAKLNP